MLLEIWWVYHPEVVVKICVLFWEGCSPWKTRFGTKRLRFASLWRPLWVEVKMLLEIRWVYHPELVVIIWCWLYILFMIYGYVLQNRPLPLTSEACYGRTVWTIEISIEYVYRMGAETLCTDFCDIWRKYVGKGAKSVFWRKCLIAEKSILAQMGVAYTGRCVMTQGIQGKNNFNYPTYGSRVISQNVKWAVIAPPWGRLM